MKQQKQKVLVVDDQQINRMLLSKILDSRYTVLQAENGLEAFNVLERERESIQVILLDLVMPVMDGFTFLEKIKNSPFANIPIIVASQANENDSELKALEMGAVDFVTKPYSPSIILQRIINTIAMRENAILRNTAERDFLTKLYNKETFYQKVSEQIHEDADTVYSLIYFDIERFKVVNDFFSEQKGDELLVYLADIVRSFSGDVNYFGARLNADCYCVCMPHDKVNELRFANFAMSLLDNFPVSLKIKINFGVFVINDINIPVSIMCDRAKLALKSIVGKYDTFIGYYNDAMHKALMEEQEIAGEMNTALRNKEFVIYIQPKFDLNTFGVIGAETLVRWKHPEKGLIPPIKFIPIFEKNGFITELDMYIFEEVCKTLRGLLDKNVPIVPVSVNLSRADIYKPDLCEFIVDVMARNNLDHHLIEFEITETSYTQDSEQLINIVNRLRELGFAISMDDFGTGYSSLNMLSEVPVDVLKIDMRFLKNFNDADVKSKNIIHFIVYMAKWLNLPVIAEGVETLEQVEYLRSVGCYNGQGYFFAKPFPIEEYEERVSNVTFAAPAVSYNIEDIIPVNDLWNVNSRFSRLFNSFACPLTLMELKGDNLELIRANKCFYNEILPCTQAFSNASCHALEFIIPEDRQKVLEELQQIDENNPWQKCVIRIKSPDTGNVFWHSARFSYLQKTNDSKLFVLHISNITDYKNKELLYGLQEERINAVFEYTKSAVIDVNISDKQFRLNTVCAGLLNMDERVFHYAELVENYAFPFEQKDEVLALFEAVFEGRRQEKPLLVSFIRKETARVWYELKYKLLPMDGDPQLAVVYLENVTHKIIRKEIFEHEMEFRGSVIGKNLNYIEFELTKKIVLRNSANFLANIGYTKDHSVDEFFAKVGNTLIHPEDKLKFLQVMNADSFNDLLLTENKKFCFECRYLNLGDFKWIRVNLDIVASPDNSEITAFCYLEELGEEYAVANIEGMRSRRDTMTGFHSEELFAKVMTNYFEQYNSGLGALFYINLSEKYSGSNCPKRSSNYSIVSMSNILRQSFRSNDLIAKIGEYSFAVLLQTVPGEDIVLQRAQELCDGMNAYNEKDFSDKIIGNVGCIMLQGQNSYQLAMENVKTACQLARQQGVNTSYLLKE